MNGMSLHPYLTGATTECQISILCLVLRLFRFVSTGASLGHFLPSFRTCVSVHRRDRCTRTPFPPILHILVLVSSLSLVHSPVLFLRTGMSVHSMEIDTLW